MCAPLAALPALAMISGGIGAAGTLVGTYAKIQQDNVQAQVADANANAEKQAAAQDQNSMNQSALARYQQISQMEGQQRAVQAANGVQVDYGSSAAQVQSTAVLGDMDVSRIYQQGFQAQRGHDVNIANDYATASAARSNAVFSGIGGVLGAAGSVMGGMSDSAKLTNQINGGGTVLSNATQYSSLAAKMGVNGGIPYAWTSGLTTSTSSFGGN